MNIYLLIAFRFIHVIASILWGGAAIAYMFFVKPSVESIGVAGPQFMKALMERRKYPIFMMVTSLLTVVSGGLLFWFISGGFNPAWFTKGAGLGFTIGSLAALVAFVVGSAGIGPSSARLAELGGQIAASGQPPSPQQLSLLKGLENKLTRAEQIDFIMLAISMLTMATARYWNF